MRLLQPAPEAAEAGLRAMRQLAAAGSGNGIPARNLMMAVQRHVLHTDHDLDSLPPITPQELGAAFRDPAVAHQFAQAMAVLSLVEGPPTEEQARLMSAYARALGVDEPALRVLSELAHHHTTLFRLDFMRRSHIADMVKGAVHREGFLATAKAFAAIRGMREDRAVLARYEALGRLPADTLGHAFWRHCTDNGFPFPGAPFGFPEAGVYHDFTHVLSGYSTEPEGELQIGGFTAGYKKHTPIFVILFVMLTFGAGVNVTPVPQPAMTGVLAQEGLADKFLRAVERGSAVNTDLSDGWDHWAWVERPLAEARRALNVPAP